MAKDPRDIFGEYDPPYNIHDNPTKEQREAAQKVMEKYERPANLGEYDRPLPPVNPNPSKEDQEKLQHLIEKYTKMAEDRKKQ